MTPFFCVFSIKIAAYKKSRYRKAGGALNLDYFIRSLKIYFFLIH